MAEVRGEFVRKLRKLLKAIMWIWAIGSLVVFWVFERMASQLRIPVGTQTQSEATKMDWSGILIPWLLYGIAPVIVLGVILYLLPGSKKSPEAVSSRPGTYCWKCGLPNPDNATFCNRCGATLREVAASPFSGASAPDGIPQGQIPEVEPAQLEGKPSAAKTISGLGGWLILVGIGLVSTPLYAVSFYIERGSLYTNPTLLLMLTTPGTQVYHPMWAFILAFEPIINVFFVLAAILLLVLFFKTKRVFKWLMISYLVLSTSLILLDFLLAHSIPAIAAQDNSSTLTGVARSIGSAAIWIPYMLKSKRVATTFVN